jgi:hypothetical protein
VLGSMPPRANWRGRRAVTTTARKVGEWQTALVEDSCRALEHTHPAEMAHYVNQPDRGRLR